MGISDLEYLISLKERGLLAKLSCICDIGATQLYLEKDSIDRNLFWCNELLA